TISAAASSIGLPEAFLGLVPGWGGIYRLPQIIGPEAAGKVIFDNAMNNNRSLKGPQAYEVGIADALLEAESFEQDSLEFAARVLAGDAETLEEVQTHRRADRSAEAWERAVAKAEQLVASKTGDTAPGPLWALRIFKQVPHRSRAESRAEEVRALGELLVSAEFHNVVYA